MWADLIGSLLLPGEEQDCISRESRHQPWSCDWNTCRSGTVCSSVGVVIGSGITSLGSPKERKVDYNTLLLLEIRGSALADLQKESTGDTYLSPVYTSTFPAAPRAF